MRAWHEMASRQACQTGVEWLVSDIRFRRVFRYAHLCFLLRNSRLHRRWQCGSMVRLHPVPMPKTIDEMTFHKHAGLPGRSLNGPSTRKALTQGRLVWQQSHARSCFDIHTYMRWDSYDHSNWHTEHISEASALRDLHQTYRSLVVILTRMIIAREAMKEDDFWNLLPDSRDRIIPAQISKRSLARELKSHATGAPEQGCEHGFTGTTDGTCSLRNALRTGWVAISRAWSSLRLLS